MGAKKNNKSDETKGAEDPSVPLFTLDEMKGKQDKAGEDACWLMIHGKVYEVSEFLDEHPGGPDIVTEYAGTDATDEYDNIGHSSDAQSMLDKYFKGKIEGYVEPEASSGGAAGGGAGMGMYLFFALLIAAAAYYFAVVAPAAGKA